MPKYSSNITPFVPRSIDDLSSATSNPDDYRPSGGSNILWAWNETDTTQFGTSAELKTSGLPGNTFALTSSAFSFVGTTSGTGGAGARLRMTTTQTIGSGGAFQHAIYSSGTTRLIVPDRFVVFMRLADLPSAGGWRVGVILWNGDTSAPWGFGCVNGEAGTTLTELVRMEGATPTGNNDPYVLSAVTKGGVDPASAGTGATGALIWWYFDVTQATVSTTPLGQCHLHYLGTNFSGTARVIPMYGAAGGFIGAGAPIAGWTNKTGLNTLSLLYKSNGSTGAAATADIAQFRILRHPADQI
jgi:hypothetical protein